MARKRGNFLRKRLYTCSRRCNRRGVAILMLHICSIFCSDCKMTD